MNICWLSRDTFDSDVVDSLSGELLFSISTTFEFGKRTITLTDARRNVVGEYMRCYGHDQVTFRGKPQRGLDWLPKKSLSRCVCSPTMPTFFEGAHMGIAVRECSASQVGGRICGGSGAVGGLR